MANQRLDIYVVESRKFQRVIPIPWAEPAPAAVEPYPGWLPPLALKRRDIDRKLLSIVLSEYPAGPGFLAGFFPGSASVTANFVQFDTKLQKPLEINVYPSTVPTPALYPSFVPVGFNFRRDIERQLLEVELNEYPVTPPGFAAGFFPGSKLAESFYTRFDAQLQEFPQLDQFTSIPPGFLSGFYPGPFVVKANRTIFKRTLQKVELDQYTLTPPGFLSGFYPAFPNPPYTKRHQKRSERRVQQLDQFTPTPPGFLSGFYPAFNLEKANLIRFDTKLQKFPTLSQYPAISFQFDLTVASFSMTAPSLIWQGNFNWTFSAPVAFAMTAAVLDLQFAWTKILKGADETYSEIAKGGSESYTDIECSEDETYTDIPKGKSP